MTYSEYNVVRDILTQVEQTCKSKGAYIRNQYSSFDKFMQFTLNKYSEFRKSIMSCLSSIKNLINELIKWAQVNNPIKNKTSLKWFEKFLSTIVKAAKHGLVLASGYMKKIMRIPIKEGIGKNIWIIGIVSSTGLVLGIVAATIVFAVSTWLTITGKVVGKMDSSPTMKEKVKSKWSNTVFYDGEENGIDQLEPPDVDVPNITMTYTREGIEIEDFRLEESGASIAAGLVFILLLKASIMCSFNREYEEKNEILKSALPSGKLVTFLALLLLVGSASAACI